MRSWEEHRLFAHHSLLIAIGNFTHLRSDTHTTNVSDTECTIYVRHRGMRERLVVRVSGWNRAAASRSRSASVEPVGLWGLWAPWGPWGDARAEFSTECQARDWCVAGGATRAAWRRTKRAVNTRLSAMLWTHHSTVTVYTKAVGLHFTYEKSKLAGDGTADRIQPIHSRRRTGFLWYRNSYEYRYGTAVPVYVLLHQLVATENYGT